MMDWDNETQLNNDTLMLLYEHNKNLETTNVTDVKNMYPLEWIIPITVVYGIIFITGLLGNISTCIVIARNKSMHTATNYYLFSLAISDLLLLISGLLPEMYRIWSPDNYIFGQTFCIIQGFAAETSANATVLTITAFTVERYVAICHPFLSHTIAKLSRIVRFIIAIWVTALCLAIPQAIQFGVEYDMNDDVETSMCSVVTEGLFEHSFEISTFLFFVGPMTLITVLYILIAIKLRRSRFLTAQQAPECVVGSRHCRISRSSRSSVAQKKVIKMLVAVVTAFFVCWAPFHAQRLIAIYLSSATPEQQATTFDAYVALIHISGVLYFLSTTINPLLYNIMSNKFRDAFKTTLAQLCSRRYDLEYKASSNTKYSVLTRYPPSLRTYQRSVSDGVQNIRISADKMANIPKSAPTSRHASTTNFRPRLISQTSQSTVLTNISRTLSTETKTKTESVLLPLPIIKRNSNTSPTNDTRNNQSFWDKCASFFKFGDYVKQEDVTSKMDSVENANTISNSSLQDMDEMEFSSSDLVRYMEEVNEDIIA